MFCGIGPDEKPPLRIAYSTSRNCSLRTLKFGPSLYSRLFGLVAEPSVPAASNVWQPPQRWLKISAPACSGSLLGTSTDSSPQPEATSRTGKRSRNGNRRRFMAAQSIRCARMRRILVLLALGALPGCTDGDMAHQDNGSIRM